jgi:hypothetical protein
MGTQSEPNLRESQLAQREIRSFKGISPSSSGWREASSRTDNQVSWVEEAKKEVQRQETSRTCETSMEDPFVSAGFATMTKEEASQEDWRVGFASITERAASEAGWTAEFALVTEEAASQEDCCAAVSDSIQEKELLPVWETEVHPNDGGWDIPLTKTEC